MDAAGGGEREDTHLLWPQLKTGPGAHVAHVAHVSGLWGCWQDQPGRAPRGSSEFLNPLRGARGSFASSSSAPSLSPQGCFRGSALPPRAPVPVGSSFTPSLAKLCGGKGEGRRQWLRSNQAARTGGTGESLGLHGHAQQLAKTQAPNLESSSVSKYHHELENSPQNETSPGPWVQSFLYTTKPARRLHLHNKKVWFWGGKVSFLEE